MIVYLLKQILKHSIWYTFNENERLAAHSNGFFLPKKGTKISFTKKINESFLLSNTDGLPMG